MERHCENAHSVASFLKSRDEVTSVRFPGLDGSWVRIAARETAMRAQLLAALDDIRRATSGS